LEGLFLVDVTSANVRPVVLPPAGFLAAPAGLVAAFADIVAAGGRGGGTLGGGGGSTPSTGTSGSFALTGKEGGTQPMIN
jgi:hypothetical protein